MCNIIEHDYAVFVLDLDIQPIETKKTLVGFHQRFSRAPQKMEHKGHRSSLHSSIQP